LRYRVKGGVDIYLLAQWFYGDPNLWNVIYYANEELIGDDPEAIVPGMYLEIPQLETGDQTYRIPAPVAV
jgi:nucleoid-associated protein YgaU